MYFCIGLLLLIVHTMDVSETMLMEHHYPLSVELKVCL